MADTDIIYQTEGPIKVQWKKTVDAAGTFATLGHSPNRERPQYSEEWLGEELGDDEHGDEVFDVVYTGRIAALQFTLSRWNLNELALFKSHATPGVASGVTEEGDMGVIGTLYSGLSAGVPDHTNMFSIRFLSSITGRTIRTFEACYFLGEGVREFDIGNVNTKLAVSCRVMRDQTTAAPVTGDQLYAKSTA